MKKHVAIKLLTILFFILIILSFISFKEKESKGELLKLGDLKNGVKLKIGEQLKADGALGIIMVTLPDRKKYSAVSSSILSGLTENTIIIIIKGKVNIISSEISEDGEKEPNKNRE